jgi:hypothetical protein
MEQLIRRLGIVTRSQAEREYEARHARLLAFRAAATHLDDMHQEGFISEHTWESLRPELLDQAGRMAQAVRTLQRANPALVNEELESARRELLRAQRGALLGLRRDGVISEETFEKLVAEIDAALMGEIAPSAEEETPEEAENRNGKQRPDA